MTPMEVIAAVYEWDARRRPAHVELHVIGRPATGTVSVTLEHRDTGAVVGVALDPTAKQTPGRVRKALHAAVAGLECPPPCLTHLIPAEAVVDLLEAFPGLPSARAWTPDVDGMGRG